MKCKNCHTKEDIEASGETPEFDCPNCVWQSPLDSREARELVELRKWSERVYHAIEHEEWAQGIIIDLVGIWDKYK